MISVCVFYAVVVCIVLFLIASVAMIAYVIWYYVLCGYLAPKTRVIASIMRKREREWAFDVPEGAGGDMVAALAWNEINAKLKRDSGVRVYESWDYYITFDVDGKEVELAVPEEVFINATEGDRGLLILKGNLFERFIPGVTEREAGARRWGVPRRR